MAKATGSSAAATVGSPIQPNASEAIVTPNCVAEMKKAGLLSKRKAACARRLPAAARVSRRGGGPGNNGELGPPKKKNSPTKKKKKKAFAPTKQRTANSFAAPFIRLVEG